MSSGALDLHLTDLAGEPVRNISVEFLRFAGEPGTGGETLHVTLAGPDPDLLITGITCRGGIGTMYRVFAEAEHYRRYGFFQLIQEDRVNTASDVVEFWVKPGDVQDIKAPTFDNLSARARKILSDAEMMAVKDEDRDLLNLKGEDLYRQLGPLRKACFLNLITKAADDTTTGGCVSKILGVLVCRQDRFFARVSAGFPEALRQSPLFRTAQEALHNPLPGFETDGREFQEQGCARQSAGHIHARQRKRCAGRGHRRRRVIRHQARIRGDSQRSLPVADESVPDSRVSTQRRSGWQIAGPRLHVPVLIDMTCAARTRRRCLGLALAAILSGSCAATRAGGGASVGPTASPAADAWHKDTLLGQEGFWALTVVLKPDYDGPVSATLIRRPPHRERDCAVLYLHGYVDYFFQAHLADYYQHTLAGGQSGKGCDFFALDLRKYGRSLPLGLSIPTSPRTSTRTIPRSRRP